MKIVSVTDFAMTYLEALKIGMENSKSEGFDKMRDGMNLLDLPKFLRCYFRFLKGFVREGFNPVYSKRNQWFQ